MEPFRTPKSLEDKQPQATQHGKGHSSYKYRAKNSSYRKKITSRNSNISEEKKKAEEFDDLPKIEGSTCYICCEPVKFMVLGECNHRGMCPLCARRRRILYKEKKCPICVAELEQIVVIPTEDTESKFEEINLSEQEEDQQSSMYFTKKSSTELENLTKLEEIKCQICLKGFNSVLELKQHVKRIHNLIFCNICLADRKVFLQEQKMYTYKDLKRHLSEGDQETQIKHEQCHFCRLTLFDNDELYYHLNQKHETCFICERQGKYYQYYKDYLSLEKHFRSAHFLCEHPECLEKKFVVFADETEKRIHEATEHFEKRGPQSKKNASRVQLQFNYSESPAQVDEQKDFEELNPERDFPALEGQTPSRRLNIHSWGRSNPATREEFPTLNGNAPQDMQPTSWGPTQRRTVPLNSQWSTREETPADHFPALPSSGKLKLQVSSKWGQKTSEDLDFVKHVGGKKNRKGKKKHFVFQF